MDIATATNSFFRRGKQLTLLIGIIVLISAGCENKTDDIRAFGKAKDITEDLHHRLKAGMFEPGVDPFICQILKVPFVASVRSVLGLKTRLRMQSAPHQVVRISWDRGTFRVKADDLAHIVIYMDDEVLFSHVQIATLKALVLSLQFRETHQFPVR